MINIRTLELTDGKLPRRALGLVLDWAELHEEELMRHSAYPDITTHMAAHQELIDQLHQISLKIAKEHLIKSDLEAFISDYFLAHMNTLDRDMVAHLRSSPH